MRWVNSYFSWVWVEVSQRWKRERETRQASASEAAALRIIVQIVGGRLRTPAANR
jgi:hypothetical protein